MWILEFYPRLAIFYSMKYFLARLWPQLNNVWVYTNEVSSHCECNLLTRANSDLNFVERTPRQFHQHNCSHKFTSLIGLSHDGLLHCNIAQHRYRDISDKYCSCKHAFTYLLSCDSSKLVGSQSMSMWRQCCGHGAHLDIPLGLVYARSSVGKYPFRYWDKVTSVHGTMSTY